MRKVLAITGVSGLIGRRVAQQAAASDHWDEILGFDLRTDPDIAPACEPVRLDVTQSFDEAFARRGVTHAIHLVFQVDPQHDLEGMRRVNLGGGANFLRACAAARVRSALVVSSATAYGARSDNPARITEGFPLRASPSFPYAHHKALIERMCARFRLENPRTAVTIVRPCVVMGPRMSNYISRMLLRPVVFGFSDESRMQAVHEQDVARAIVALSAGELPGPYNVAPPDAIGYGELARRLGRPFVRLPAPVLRAAVSLAWRLRLRALSEVPPGFLDYIRYSWCVSSERLRQRANFRFLYSTGQTIEDWIRAVEPSRPVPADAPLASGPLSSA